ncbi:FAD/NAD(P)-binding protein [Actinokineospora enzanensis]|uniref:FAD/NAD(P)-binding protein n=1 Tax=Actinokineospora enzanensis TaxID=155975 RepID=UPI00037480CA|nr:FAD/NAD(P)-binding protein [Actinokineospora enzanensis]
MTAPPATYALIGCGPRGMNVLERFIFHATRDPLRRPITLHIVDPAAVGPGIHGDQPDYLLLNTIATQLTTFVDDDMVDEGGVRGPSFYQWVRRRGTLVTADTGETRPARPTDHLPRRLLGEYLSWALPQLLDVCPPWLEIRLHDSTATAVDRLPDGREQVTTADGTTVPVDAVLLCVGHTGTPAPRPAHPDVPDSAWIATPYPLPDTTADIAAGERLGILGCGLTAMDVIAALTVGRGGRYEKDDGGLRYLPSGDEPELVLITRTGHPARARPRPYQAGPIPPRYLTVDALREARARKEDGRLNLLRDVLPLVQQEMRHRVRALVGPDEAEQAENRVLSAWDAPVPDTALSDVDSYHAWFVDRVRQDLAEAHRGLDASPLKAAFEVHRDLREVLRRAVDGSGLDDRADFFGAFAAEINRNVIGPQLDRNEELLALVRAGVLSPGLGPMSGLTWSDGHWLLGSTTLATPTTTTLRRVIRGFSPSPTISRSTNPVVRQLHATGRLRPVAAGDTELGAHVDADGFAVDEHGPQPTLAVLGPLAEGSSYYNHYVTSPGAPSRATADADRVVRSVLSVLDRQVALL